MVIIQRFVWVEDARDYGTKSGANDFYRRIRDIFEAAKLNAPSIIFIDDSDVIFESGEEYGEE